MKGLKLSLVIMAAALLTISLGGMAYAFHDGGVANCESCHTMHNSIGNVTVVPGGTPLQGVAYLLKNTDQSSTCINCHGGTASSGKNVFTTSLAVGAAPVNYTPGGDFSWLTKSYSSSLPGDRLGHNVVAKDFSLQADATLKNAPGGTYKNTDLSCISCHDPHPAARQDASGAISYRGSGQIIASGSYGPVTLGGTDKIGTYRLLGGNGYVPKSVGSPVFANDPPVAVAPSTYNRKETSTDTRVAYGKGMSEWCSNCHGTISQTDAATHFIHPAANGAVLGTTIAANYNAYKMSGNLTNTVAASYTSLVPFEEGSSDLTFLLSETTKTTGPGTTTENVMCLSCHRAHASGFKNITRWNNAEFITKAGVYSLTGTMTDVEYTAAMYDRPASVFATYQRSLCNKCHVKD